MRTKRLKSAPMNDVRAAAFASRNSPVGDRERPYKVVGIGRAEATMLNDGSKRLHPEHYADWQFHAFFK